MNPGTRTRAIVCTLVLVATALLAMSLLRDDDAARSSPGAARDPGRTADRVAADLAPDGSTATIAIATEVQAAAAAPIASRIPARPGVVATDRAPKPPRGPVLRLRGVVVDAAGAPCSGAELEVRGVPREGALHSARGEPPDIARAFVAALDSNDRGESSHRVGRLRAGVDGGFEARLAPEQVGAFESFIVAAESPAGGLGLIRKALDPRCLDGVQDLGRIVMQPTGRLDVVVQSAGRPLAGAVVWLGAEVVVQGSTLDEMGVDIPMTATTDEGGVASFRLRGREMRLAVTAPGHARAVLDLGGALTFEADARVELALLPAAEVRGLVVGPGRATLAGIELRAEPVGGGLSGSGGASDERGRFSIRDLAAGVTYDLQASDRSGEHVDATTRVTAPADVELALEPAASLLISFLSVKPPAGVQAHAFVLEVQRAGPSGDWAWGRCLELRSRLPGVGRESGLGAHQRRLLGLAPGRYRVRAGPGVGRGTAWGEVVVRAGEEAALELRLGVGRALRGHLVDARGAPAAKVLVSLRTHTLHGGGDLRVLTDERGGFTFADLSPELVSVEIGRLGFRPRPLKLTSQDDVDVGAVQLEPETRAPE